MNIPIYRAKKMASDKYIQGYLLGMRGEYFISWGETNHVPNKVQIDPTTLAIHFPDMLDSEGNKIFASLSEDGKGGDILEHANILTNDKMLLVASYHKAKGEFGAYSGTHYIRSMKFHLTKIVGVQE